MKAMNKLVWLALVMGGLVWCGAPLHAQGVPAASDGGEALHTQQLAAEREALVTMLNDGNTPAERRVSIQHLLDLNSRGLTLSEVKKLNAAPPAPPPANNLAEAEAAPVPANVNMGGGALLQNFSKGRDAEASARSSASLGLVKTQQEMENATRESEAKLREAQHMRNSAGAAALAQRQQETAGAASQQAAGGMGAVLGDSLVQSVQQGAQAAGQAIGGGAVGRMGGALGPTASGGGGVSDTVGGATAAGASAAAGQIFGGGAPAVEPAMGGGTPAEVQPATPVNANMEAAADMSAMRSAGKRLFVPNSKYQTDGKPYLPPKPAYQTDGKPYLPPRPPQYQTEGRPAIPNTRPAAVELSGMQNRTESVQARDRRIAQPQYHPEAEVFQKGGKTLENQAALGESVQSKGPMHWVQTCPRHGKYSGTGALTGCPKCVGYIR